MWFTHYSQVKLLKGATSEEPEVPIQYAKCLADLKNYGEATGLIGRISELYLLATHPDPVMATTNYQAKSTDYTIVLNAASTSVRVTLPLAPDLGKRYNLACLDDTNGCIVDFNGKNLYDDPSDFIIVKGENLVVEYDGTEWVGG